MNITNLSAEQLRRAAQIKDQIDELNAELSNILDGSTPSAEAPTRRGRRKMSATARAKIAAAQKARWAKQKGARKGAKAPKKARHKMSAAGRARIAAAAKARWAKAKAQGKTTLKGA